jgi:hypothetical protein
MTPEQLSVTALRSSSGEPAKVASTLAGRIWLSNQYNDSHNLFVFVRYRRSIS